MKKNLDELSEIEQEIVSQFIKNPRPGLGIETVVLTATESYVVFSKVES
jgi:hypothetical protein